MNDLISIIVPIYKVEKYLKKCVESILAQSYSNLDIILVDDGSPDKCGKIIEEFRKEDKRIRTLHQNNGGLSDARNNGIKIANGKYVICIDSDDWIEKDMIEVLYNNIIKTNSDISICEFIEEDDEGNILSNKKYNNEIIEFNSKKALKSLIKQDTLTNHAWNKLYKKNLFEGIEYPKGQLMEDVSTTYKLFEKAKKIVYQNTELYHYIQRGTSILGNITEKRIADQEQAFFDRNKYLVKKYPEFKTIIELDNLYNIKTLYYLAIMGGYKKLYNSKKYTEYYTEYKKIYKKNKKNLKIEGQKSLQLFYQYRNIYKLYVKLKKKIKGN